MLGKTRSAERLPLIRLGSLKGEELAQAVEVIERNAKLQSQLIDDLLDMNRITSGKARLDLRLVQVLDVIEAALGTVRPSAQVKGIHFSKPAI